MVYNNIWLEKYQVDRYNYTLITEIVKCKTLCYSTIVQIIFKKTTDCSHIKYYRWNAEKECYHWCKLYHLSPCTIVLNRKLSKLPFINPDCLKLALCNTSNYPRSKTVKFPWSTSGPNRMTGAPKHGLERDGLFFGLYLLV